MAVFPGWGWGSSVVSQFGGHFKVGLISEGVLKLIFQNLKFKSCFHTLVSCYDEESRQ